MGIGVRKLKDMCVFVAIGITTAKIATTVSKSHNTGVNHKTYNRISVAAMILYPALSTLCSILIKRIF
jgi:hypothetical protein